MNFPLLYRQYHSAAGFPGMVAIIEFASSDIRMKLHEAPRQIFFFDMIQAEFLETGRIDDGAIVIETIKLRMCSGVGAGIERQ